MMLARQPVKEPAPAEAGIRVSSIFSSTQAVSFEYLPDHFVIQAARSRRASARLRRSYSQRRFLQTVVVDLARHVDLSRICPGEHFPWRGGYDSGARN